MRNIMICSHAAKDGFLANVNANEALIYVYLFCMTQIRLDVFLSSSCLLWQNVHYFGCCLFVLLYMAFNANTGVCKTTLRGFVWVSRLCKLE